MQAGGSLGKGWVREKVGVRAKARDRDTEWRKAREQAEGGLGQKDWFCVSIDLSFTHVPCDSMCVSVSVCCWSRQIHLGINRMIFPPAGSEAAKGWLGLLYSAALRRPWAGTQAAPEARTWALLRNWDAGRLPERPGKFPGALKALLWTNPQQQWGPGPPDAL